MPDRTIIFSTNGRHGVRGQITQINPAEFQALQDDDDDLTYVFDMSAYLEGATISSVTRTPWGVSVTNASNTTTRLTQRLRGFGYVDYKLTLSSGDTEEFRVHISRRAPTALSSQAQAAIEVPVATTSALDPTTSDDSTRNFVPGNLWINTASLNQFTCISNAAGAARWRHHPRIIMASAVAVPLTGTVAETSLASGTLNAGAMGTDGALIFDVYFTCTNNANSKVLQLRANGIAGSIWAATTQTAVRSFRGQFEIRNRGSASSQVLMNGVGTGGWSTTVNAASTDTLNTANDLSLLVTGTLGNSADTLQLEYYRLTLWRPDIA